MKNVGHKILIPGQLVLEPFLETISTSEACKFKLLDGHCRAFKLKECCLSAEANAKLFGPLLK